MLTKTVKQKMRLNHVNESSPGAMRQRIVPNPKLKLLDQVREVMRLKHYSIHTERSYCEWVRRYVHFHGMQSRADLAGAEAKIEQFLSHLAVFPTGPLAAPYQGVTLTPHAESLKGSDTIAQGSALGIVTTKDTALKGEWRDRPAPTSGGI